jgi:hypothetical protein
MAWIETDDGGYVNLATAAAIHHSGICERHAVKTDRWRIVDQHGQDHYVSLPAEVLQRHLHPVVPAGGNACLH